MLALEAIERCRGLGIVIEDELADRIGVESRRLGVAEKCLERSGEPERVIKVRKVASVVEYLQTTAGHGLVCGLRVLDRDDPIVAAPDDQRWHS